MPFNLFFLSKPILLSLYILVQNGVETHLWNVLTPQKTILPDSTSSLE